MDLATFGAIMSYALDLETRTVAFYEAAARGDLEKPFSDMLKHARKRATRVERMRREMVNEMILEPIAGMDGDDYLVEPSLEGGEEQILDQALVLAKATFQFYSDAAEKIPVREVVQLCKRMAKESNRRIAELEALKG